MLVFVADYCRAMRDRQGKTRGKSPLTVEIFEDSIHQDRVL